MSGAIIVCIAGVMAMLTIYFVLPLFTKLLLVERLHRRCASTDCIVLTFDDGPDPESTPQILDTLLSYKIKAAFFVLGERAAEYPDLIRRMVAEGHDVGEHGFAHLHGWKTLPNVYLRDLFLCRRTIESVAGRGKVCFMRPAYGKLNALTMLYACATTRPIALWTVDARDYESSTPEEVFARTIDAIRRGQGGVILLHDGRREAEHSPVEVRSAQFVNSVLGLPQDRSSLELLAK